MKMKEFAKANFQLQKERLMRLEDEMTTVLVSYIFLRYWIAVMWRIAQHD